jgi:hypothetical protein
MQGLNQLFFQQTFCGSRRGRPRGKAVQISMQVV